MPSVSADTVSSDDVIACAKVAAGKYPQDNNPLVNAPHTLACAMDDDWDRPYKRSLAAFPTGAYIIRVL